MATMCFFSISANEHMDQPFLNLDEAHGAIYASKNLNAYSSDGYCKNMFEIIFKLRIP